jgi:hypothetical protein
MACKGSCLPADRRTMACAVALSSGWLNIMICRCKHEPLTTMNCCHIQPLLAPAFLIQMLVLLWICPVCSTCQHA